MTTRPPFPGSPEYLAALTQSEGRAALSPLARVALISVAWAGTVAYGVHVYRLLADENLAWVGPGIAGGAAAAWVVLLAWMLLRVRDRKRLAKLGDHALITLTVGMVWVLLALAATTAFALPTLPTHVVLLTIGNVLMGTYFIAKAPRPVLTRAAATVLWVGLMNGVLALGVVLTGLWLA